MKSNKYSLKEKYEKEVRPLLKKEFGVTAAMAVPGITKIVVNVGTGELLKNKEAKEKLMKDLAMMTGQKPKVQEAHISVAGFGIRKGNPVGLSVTLRRKRMYEFLGRLISIVLPRLRDFRGLPFSSFDKHGNYSIGFPEYSVFPEIDVTKVEKSRGVEITIVTNARNVEKSKRLLTLMGLPFEKIK